MKGEVATAGFKLTTPDVINKRLTHRAILHKEL